jgi:S-adenosylmethionine-diacylglycerol 3-amino-3-carboxypropyl transferase
MANALLQQAAHQAPPATPRGVLERIFTLVFQGFVYNQIWEDPSVDLDALKLSPHHRVVTIASGGCNVLNYLAAQPAKIIALDLNPHHVALTRLKLAALEHLPDYESFFRFFGAAADPANLAAFDTYILGKLDPQTRAYWQATHGAPRPRRRIEMFARNLYRHGLLGRFIGLLHGVARLHGKKLADILEAKTPAEQRELFDSVVAPLFESAPVKLISKSPISLYALGIPPAQYDELVSSGRGNPISVLRERVERLACDFPIRDNYFAWQAFGRGYDLQSREAVPDYLKEENYAALKARAASVTVHHASMIDFLKSQPAQSLDRFVLLDAQDWMSPAQMTALWAEIDRTAHSSDARVIFRTAGESSPLPQKLPGDLLAPWLYHEWQSRVLHAQDRSSIYGGFHIYARRPLS